MLAKDLIDRIENLGLLDQDIIVALREQLQQSGARVTPEAVAKLLVDNGQLTSFQATKLIGDLRNQPAGGGGGGEEPLVAGLAVEDDDIFSAEPVAAEPVAVEAIPVDAVPVAAVPVGASSGATAGVGPGDGGVSNGGGSGARSGSHSAGNHSTGNRPTRQRPVREEPNQWDSFKIYGYAGIIVGLLLTGFALWFILSREDAEKVIGRADEFYQNDNYEAAQEAYVSFLDDYGQENKYSSAARAKIVMTQLYKAAQFKQEPGQAIDVAKEKLPAVAEEEGMNDQRGNLAQLLVDIANNITTAADKADATERKRELLGELTEVDELIANPVYMPGSMRASLAPQLKTVEEVRARVQRDINRNLQLDASEQQMQAQLDEKATKAAYDTRMSLLRDFPELHDHPRLQTLINTASDIQQTLVRPSTSLPQTVDPAPPQQTIKSVVLKTLDGRAAPELAGETLYLRAGGSVMAFDGESGQLRWRKFVGYAKNLPPVRFPGGDGVLLSDSDDLTLARVDAASGDPLWRTRIGDEFLAPITDRSGAYVTVPRIGSAGDAVANNPNATNNTDAGDANQGGARLISLDIDSGDPLWATEYPQSVSAGPGVDRNTDSLYQAGGHSNLYRLNMRDGACTESFYLGHGPGTIAVPPMPLLGHVFVIENATVDYAKIHVLRVDEDGQNLRVAQPPFRLVGNVRVTPTIEGRQLIVLTDRGQVKVLDIEPTKQNDQVTEAASLPPFYEQPTETEMVVGNQSMWIAGTRLGRYDLQIAQGRIVRKWSLHELDQFIGTPFYADGVLVHSRILRGSSAIRVTAADPSTGDEIWRTDVGVPVAAIRRSPAGDSFHAITSQAALFELDRQALASGSTGSPLEDPGAGSVGIRYAQPVELSSTEQSEFDLVMLDQSGGQKMLLYRPTRPAAKVAEVTMQLPAGRATASAVNAGGGVFIPLDTGRAVLVNPITGGMLATPFQPITDPRERVKWSDAVTLPDDPDQVVLADDRGSIYRLRVGPQIRELAKQPIATPLLGSAAGVGRTYVATTSGADVDSIIGFDMTGLDVKFDRPLPGRVVWGPAPAVGAATPMALLLTADGNLLGIGEDGRELFSTPLGSGRPIGNARVVDGNLTLAMQAGELVTINADSGQITGRIEIGQPISASPLSVGPLWLVPGREGVVYVVPR